MKTTYLKFLVIISLVALTKSENCPKQFLNKCECGRILYQDKERYVVNCTNVGFTNTNMLEHLPNQTEVLIFVGNSISKLPWNVFGASKNYTKLKIIDMTDNNIKEILGKSFHGVPNVERLILNHNKITLLKGEYITSNHLHPRVFSNFINLLELHLTNAFEDNYPDLASDLHEIFLNSELKNLVKLHLEQNEISSFKDHRVFCELPSLMDLHLGNNYITNIDFDILCLQKLRFIDLEQNKITKLSARDLRIFDRFVTRNQSLSIDLGGNPFTCDCDIPDFYTWLQNTKVLVRDKDELRCHHGLPAENNGKSVVNLRKVNCDGKLLSATPATSHTTITLLIILTIALVFLLGFLIYTNRQNLKHRINPILNTVSRKVYYTSIGKQDDQEIDV